jgi:hypothetical protein
MLFQNILCTFLGHKSDKNEYARRKSKGNIMTNGEKYAGESHNHYVFERRCPKCNNTVCGREQSDFRECKIKDKHDYEQWLKEFV